MVLATDGAAWFFGRNGNGALGIPPGAAGDEYISENAPMKLLPVELGADEGTKFVHAACGRNHTLLVGSDGNVWSAGANSLGQVRDSFHFSLAFSTRLLILLNSVDIPFAMKLQNSGSSVV